ncbi:MAG: hypothetical protein ACI8UO_003317 [Verrucomicrobiales bacterium]|jgi:hypothetical protein
MSAHKSVKDLPEGGEMFDGKKAAMLKLGFLVVGVIGLGITLAVLFFGGEDEEGIPLSGVAAYSYLFAIIFFFTIAVGGLFWTMLHNATNSGWGTVVRRQMENIAGMVPWVFLLMIPFLFEDVRAHLWEWEPKAKTLLADVNEKIEAGAVEEFHEAWWDGSQPVTDELNLVGIAEQEAKDANEPGNLAALQMRKAALDREFKRLDSLEPDEDSVRRELMLEGNYLLAHKWYGYFNWAYPRLLICAAVLILLATLLRTWSLKTDSKLTADKYFKRSRYWSCGMIAFFGVSFTFVVVDLLMTLSYEWFSTMWGVYLFAGAALNSMAVLILVVTYLRSKGYLKEVVSMEHYHAMGKLLFAFTVFWAYIAFSQFFLIWYANITEETVFYLLRNSDGWNSLSLFLVLGHFMMPFVLLLFQTLKKRPAILAIAAIWTLGMHFIDMYWIVIPERGPSLSFAATGSASLMVGGYAILLDIVAFLGVTGILGFIFLHNLKRHPLYPVADPRLEESINLAN